MTGTRIFRGFRVMTMQSGGEPYGLQPEPTSVLVENGTISWVGPDANLPDLPNGTEVITGGGHFLSPGLIDCHTHLVYGGSRADEWEQRLLGVPYEEIARRGGGILSTVRATRAASEEQLLESASRRATHLLRQGVTTIEIKSGYGLDLETELRMLRVIERLRDEVPLNVSATLLGAHALPMEYSDRADEYIDLVCNEMVPAAAGLCDAVDVFCESIAFNLSQTERVFQAATDAGLAIKVHAEQLSHTGAAALAARMGAVSADHLEYLSDSDCSVLAEHGTVATLLPGAFYNLRETQKPPVRELRQAGVPIAIATDANPGSSPVASVLLMAHMACTFFGLTPEEAIVGLTRHAARALKLDGSVGTIAPGSQADFAVWNISTPAELAYGIGHNPCVAVYRRGDLVWNTEPVGD